MTSEKLIHIIAGREGEQVEFKPSLLSRREQRTPGAHRPDRG